MEGARPAPGPPPQTLVVHPGALGDLVCLFPLFAELRRRHGPLALLCQDSLGRLACFEGVADAAYPLEAAWTASLFSGAPSPEARRRLAPLARVIAFSRAPALIESLERLEGGKKICALPARPPAAERRHVARHARERLAACGLLPAAPPPEGDYRPPPPPGSATRRRVVFLHPGAGSPRKRWPLERFMRTAERLEASGFMPQWLLGPAEEDLAGKLAGGPRPLNRLSDPVALARLLRAACGYIGNDSGATHLAAWVGVPTVAIFGPSDPERWRPNGPAVQVVAAPCDRAPCFETDRENCAAGACLAKLAPAAVLGAFRRLESQWRPPAASMP